MEDTDVIALESLPDLEFGVGAAGQMRHVEVGGDVCMGVVISVAIYAVHDGRA